MSLYLKAHQIWWTSFAATALVIVALVTRSDWVQVPQLGDGTGRGVPLSLITVSFLGALITVAYSLSALAIEQHRLGRRLLAYDLAGVLLMIGPGLIIAWFASLFADQLGVNAAVRDLLLAITVTLVMMSFASPEVAACAPVGYALTVGLFGTRGNGRPASWAFALERNVRWQELAVMGVVAAISVTAIDRRIRTRAAHGWIGPQG